MELLLDYNVELAAQLAANQVQQNLIDHTQTKQHKNLVEMITKVPASDWEKLSISELEVLLIRLRLG